MKSIIDALENLGAAVKEAKQSRTYDDLKAITFLVMSQVQDMLHWAGGSQLRQTESCPPIFSPRWHTLDFDLVLQQNVLPILH